MINERSWEGLRALRVQKNTPSLSAPSLSSSAIEMVTQCVWMWSTTPQTNQGRAWSVKCKRARTRADTLDSKQIFSRSICHFLKCHLMDENATDSTQILALKSVHTCNLPRCVVYMHNTLESFKWKDFFQQNGWYRITIQIQLSAWQHSFV